MIGKKNIVFGLIYLVATAALGPYMVDMLQSDTITQARSVKQERVGLLQQIADNEFDDPESMSPISAERLAQANTKGVLALSMLDNSMQRLEQIRGGPHSHGNLESVLNIVIGLVLLFMAAPALVKQLISWLFILGALLHSGMLYLRLFDIGWANTLLQIGPWLLLAGLLLAGIAALLWLKPVVVRD